MFCGPGGDIWGVNTVGGGGHAFREYVPVVHGLQRLPGVEDFPLSHAVQLDAPENDDVPAAHGAGGFDESGSPVPSKQ